MGRGGRTEWQSPGRTRRALGAGLVMTWLVAAPARANQPPVEAALVDVLANDMDPDGDRLAVTVAGSRAVGSVDNPGDGTLVYVPPSGGFTEQGQVSFTAPGPVPRVSVRVAVGLASGAETVAALEGFTVPMGSLPAAALVRAGAGEVTGLPLSLLKNVWLGEAASAQPSSVFAAICGQSTPVWSVLFLRVPIESVTASVGTVRGPVSLYTRSTRIPDVNYSGAPASNRTVHHFLSLPPPRNGWVGKGKLELCRMRTGAPMRPVHQRTFDRMLEWIDAGRPWPPGRTQIPHPSSSLGEPGEIAHARVRRATPSESSGPGALVWIGGAWSFPTTRARRGIPPPGRFVLGSS